jgi:hypothetical protein
VKTEQREEVAPIRTTSPSRTPSTGTKRKRYRREFGSYPTTRLEVDDAMRAGYITPRGRREMLKRGDLW